MITIDNNLEDGLIGLIYKNSEPIGSFRIDKECKTISIINKGDITLNDTIEFLKLINGKGMDYFQFQLEISQ